MVCTVLLHVFKYDKKEEGVRYLFMEMDKYLFISEYVCLYIDFLNVAIFTKIISSMV